MIAPQYGFRGLGMDYELLDWLDTYTFPEEAKYKDADYAFKQYSMAYEMVRAVQVSKIRWRYVNAKEMPINMMDAFYMAIRIGGEFFGNVGCFEEGYEFNAIIVDDSTSKTYIDLNEDKRVERMFYLAHECSVKAKFVLGEKII